MIKFINKVTIVFQLVEINKKQIMLLAKNIIIQKISRQIIN